MFETNEKNLYLDSNGKADEKRVYTVKEIQKILGICRSTAYRLVESEEFHCVKVCGHYRISKKCFERWLEEKEGGSKNGIC